MDDGEHVDRVRQIPTFPVFQLHSDTYPDYWEGVSTAALHTISEETSVLVSDCMHTYRRCTNEQGREACESIAVCAANSTTLRSVAPRSGGPGMRCYSIGASVCMGGDASEYLSRGSRSIMTRKQWKTSVRIPAAISPFAQCTVPPGADCFSC